MGRLQTLPVELKVHIAGFCSPQDILALAASCRSLRDVYNSTVVFRKSFECEIPELWSRSITNKNDLISSIKKQLDRLAETEDTYDADQYTSWWKYLAVLASQLEPISGDLDGQVPALCSRMEAGNSEETVDITVAARPLQKTMELLTTSIVWGCQTYCDKASALRLEELCILICSGQSSDLEAPRLLKSLLGLEASFCLAICAIQRFPVSRPDYEDPDTTAELNLIGRTLNTYLVGLFSRGDGTQIRISRVIIPPNVALLLCAVAACVSWKNNGVHPLLDEIPLLSQDQSQSPPDPLVSSHTRNAERMKVIPLPAVTMMPKDQDRLFTPFSTCGWKLWYVTRSEALIHDIGSGEWEGMYTYMFDVRERRMDSLMRRIRFRIRTHHLRDRIGVRATNCIDAVGEFKLEGFLFLETCELLMRKTYIGRHHFEWKGAVTPLGLVGCYMVSGEDGRIQGHPLGAFWLWRRDWKGGGPWSKEKASLDHPA